MLPIDLYQQLRQTSAWPEENNGESRQHCWAEVSILLRRTEGIRACTKLSLSGRCDMGIACREL